MRIAILVAIALLAGGTVLRIVWDIKRYWAAEKLPLRKLLPRLAASFVVYFLAAFGISDFALFAVIYSKTDWIPPRDLPGTLNTQGLAVLVVISCAYITSVDVEPLTIVPFLLCAMLGSWLGPRVTVKTPVWALKYVMATGLLIAGSFMLLSKLSLLPGGGDALGLHGWKLWLFCLLGVGIGFVKTMGVGSYPLVMACVFLFGLNPVSAYPMMTGSAALGNPLSGLQFVKLNAYSRIAAFCGFTAGLVGAFLAVLLFRNLDVTVLQWIILVVIFLAALDMLFQAHKLRKAALAPAEPRA